MPEFPCLGRVRLVVGVTTLLAVLHPPFSSTSAAPTGLSFSDRILAQEAIERVYYSHQEGATRHFQQAVPVALLEDKVRSYLKQSAALADLWSRPVTSEMLQAELERIQRETRFPARLEEIYAALNHDSVLIQETFVRAVLVDRLARSFFAFDDRIHDADRHKAEGLRKSLIRAGGNHRHEGREPRVLALERVHGAVGGEAGSWAIFRGPRDQLRPGPDGAARPPSPGADSVLSPQEVARWREALPDEPGQVGPITESGAHFSVAVLVAEEPGRVEAAIHTFTKRTWDEWWSVHRLRFDENRVEVVAASNSGREPEEPAGAIPGQTDSGCLPDDLWTPYLTTTPSEFDGLAAVWTGTRLVLWGGDMVVTPFLYDPLTDSWSRGTIAGAPELRRNPSAVWTGTEVIVWGGGYPLVGGGGRYNPATDNWTPMATTNAPSPRVLHSAAWTGTEMIIWGGVDGSAYLDSGGRYDPAADTWTATNSSGAPSARIHHTAVWSGGELLVWGGREFGGVPLGEGARYDPAADSWTAIPTAGAPAPREVHAAVWTGSQMVVWGGRDAVAGLRFDSGGRYDPATDTWTPTTTTGAPSPRLNAGAVWTSSEMIVWGGQDPNTFFDTGGRYDPGADSWTPTTTLNAPPAASVPRGAWTGSEVIFVGGVGALGPSSSGGRYDPATDTWAPLQTSGNPEWRFFYSSVWTGNRFIVWGGSWAPFLNQADDEDTGGRFDPLTSSWAPTATTDAPSPRVGHTAVWTGQEMIVWGGADGLDGDANSIGTGGRYDPVADGWTPTSTTGAPSPRLLQSAVWSGTEMLIWGGSLDMCTDVSTGARYDPITDSWTTMTLVNAPAATNQFDATTIWTGSEMIVWGGWSWSGCVGSGPQLGARYDPAADTWADISPPPWEGGRLEHSAVWTGSEMIIWGGKGPGSANQINSGNRYDPATDTWTAISTTGAPSERLRPGATWTGAEMIIWSGFHWVPTGPGSFSGAPAPGGGRYDPVRDRWLPMSPVNEPNPRYYFEPIWTGSEMLVWGGFVTLDTFDGGRYSLGGGTDDDGDGFSECDGDCYDADPDVYPGAPEICDFEDSDCDGFRPPDEIDGDGDGVLLCFPDCDDADPLRYPGSVELCDRIDNDCDLILPPGEIDSDSDGLTPCESDCDDTDPTLLTPPSAITGLAADNPPGGMRLTWDSQAISAGTATIYDVYSGSGVLLRPTGGDFSAGGCAASNSSVTLHDDLSADPPPGSVSYFLIRAKNACGTGTWGDANRDATTAMSASPCP